MTIILVETSALPNQLIPHGRKTKLRATSWCGVMDRVGAVLADGRDKFSVERTRRVRKSMSNVTQDHDRFGYGCRSHRGTDR
jgi:hypothetical protein